MKQKRQLGILIALLVVAAGVWWFYLRDDKPAVIADAGTQSYIPLPVDDPKIRVDEIDKARKTEYKNANGRNIFTAIVPPPPPTPQQIKKAAEAQAQAQAIAQQQVVIEPPKVAPIPAKFFGFGTVPNGTAKLAFFNNTEGDVFVVREGELLQNRFRILKINNNNLDYEDTTTKLRGTAPLEEQASSPGAPPQ